MKIIKEKDIKLTKAKLTEADEGTIEVDKVSEPELADEIKAGSEKEAEITGNEDVELTDDQAAEVAEVAKDFDKKNGDVGVILQTLGTNNLLTNTLDEALESALDAQEDGISDGAANVLITGLPGSGKSAIVKNWCKRHNLNYFYLDAKNSDLEAAINGFMLRDETKTNAVTMGVSHMLDPLERPNSVLFLDELNRQTKANVRGSLLSLINEHAISGKDGDGYKYFNNILFAIACINPATSGVRSVGELDDAETSRFGFNIEYDSNASAAMDYFEKKYNALMANLEHKNKSGQCTEEYYKKHFTNYVCVYEIVQKLLTDPSFSFDTASDAEELRDGPGRTKTLFNQRNFEWGVDRIAHGKKDKVLKWVKEHSNLLKKRIDMFEDILLDYEDPRIGFSRDKNGYLVGKVLNDDEEADNWDDEVDTDLFAGSGDADAPKVSPIEAKNRIKTFVDKAN